VPHMIVFENKIKITDIEYFVIKNNGNNVFKFDEYSLMLVSTIKNNLLCINWKNIMDDPLPICACKFKVKLKDSTKNTAIYVA